MRVGVLIRLDKNVYECIRHAAELGFKSGQISVWDMSLYSEETAQLIQRACKDFKFAITAIWCGWSGPREWSYPDMYGTIGLIPTAWRARRAEELLVGAAFARKIGVKDIITHIGFLPDNPLDSDRIAVVQVVRYICREIEQYGQRFLLETGEELPGTLVQFMHETGVQNIGVNFDPANLLINGRANPTDGLERLAPYIYGFHGKDGLYPEGINPKGREVKIGEGRVDFPALIKMLAKMKYEGDITIEREIPDSKERDQEIIEEKAYLEKIIADI